MITGSVSNLHVLVPIILRLPHQPDITIEFVVDTGFTGALTLPMQAITALGLPFVHRAPAKLADNTPIDVPTYRTRIVWDGAEREERVLAIEGRPLLGTELLSGHELVVQFAEGGLVTIETL